MANLIARRAFLSGLFAAPAIVRATSLMSVKNFLIAPPEPLIVPTNQLLTREMISREAVRLWRASNSFLHNVDRQYAEAFSPLREAI